MPAARHPVGGMVRGEWRSADVVKTAPKSDTTVLGADLFSQWCSIARGHRRGLAPPPVVHEAHGGWPDNQHGTRR